MLALLAGCASTGPAPDVATEPAVRVILVGDVMLGRGVAPVVATDPASVFEGVRYLISSADIAAANLESPLTTRPHVADSANTLEADPGGAAALSAAGFDVMALPNNHTLDAGLDGLGDTVAALDEAGIGYAGADGEDAVATEPLVVTASGLRVGFLAFDTAGSASGIAHWEGAPSLEAATTARQDVDVLVVSLHGGTEYLPTTDPGIGAIATQLADAGVDVVWGHGAHVVQPVTVTTGERPTVVATSLGNFLFDQVGADRTTGYLLEVLVAESGVLAYRVGITQHPDRRVEFVEWLDPVGDAAWLDDSWWSLARDPVVAATTSTALDEFRHGDLVAAAIGDVDGNGNEEVVASFRRPHQTTPFMETHPEVQWVDAQGRDAHLGVYGPGGLEEVWVAGTVLMPIAALEVCDQSLAVIHDQLDDPSPIAGGAWIWNGFGFETASTIPGSGTPACADIDGDGVTEPVILAR